MRNTPRLALIGVMLGTAACSGADDRQWMKVNQRYTTSEFQQDFAACSKNQNKTLDEECMKSRGWIEVNRSKSEQDNDPRAQEPARARPQGATPFGGRTTIGR